MQRSTPHPRILRPFCAWLALACAALGGEPSTWPSDLSDSTTFAASSDYFAGSDDFQFASTLLQPPTVPALEAPTTPAPRRYATGGRQAGNRLASVPHMFGDAPTVPFAAQASNSFTTTVTGTIPTPGFGGLGAKLAENDRPIPIDRVFFNYNHFNNVFSLTEDNSGSVSNRLQSINRYTLGFEKTFNDGWSSVEMRMPFHAFDLNGFDYALNGGNVGNLAIVLKRLLYIDDALAVGAGMCLDAPTGSDVFVRMDGGEVRIRNEAVHLLPYVGFNYAPFSPRTTWGDGIFFTGILQLSVATNGNSVVGTDIDDEPIATGKLTDPTLLLLDFNAGYWLYRDPSAPRWTGLAVVGEIHYTTMLQNVDAVNTQLFGFPAFVGGGNRRLSIPNATIGLQALLFDASAFRVAGAFPLSDQLNRLFDSEVQFQFNRMF